jgi:hypothetical protein
MNSIIRHWGDGNGAVGTGSATGEHECVKIAQITSAIEEMRSPRFTFDIPLGVDHADWPNRRGVDGWEAAQVTVGVPDVTLTCTSIPR